VVGVVVVLVVVPFVGFGAGFVLDRAARRATRRATTRMRRPVRAAQWCMAGGMSFAHGANDAQKAVGLATVVLLAEDEIHRFAAPTWTVLACSVALAVGTATGGWPIVHTIGRRIVRLRPLDSLASQTASTAVLLGSSLLGAPVSTTHVVASSVVGVGAGRRRWRHIDWSVVRAMSAAWLVTLPVVAALAAVALVPWGWWT
jgi:PiT family inorganic phosphate transporter